MLGFRTHPHVRAASFALPVLPRCPVPGPVRPRRWRALGAYLKPRVSSTAEPQLVAAHLFHFINKIVTSIDRGFCPLIVRLSLRQLMGMTFCLCSHFHNDIQGQA